MSRIYYSNVSTRSEIEPSQLLVQAWRAGNWDKGIYSIIKFDLEVIYDSNTKLLFEHSGFPEGRETHLESGWNEIYWEPLKICLENEKPISKGII